jgi:translation initiation factor 2 alpha subunit (eIF-2alpha)
MDVWAMDKSQADTLIEQFRHIKKGLSPEKRSTVLQIKDYYCNRPEYRVDVKSLDIYNAVLNYNIDSVESFKTWLKTR